MESRTKYRFPFSRYPAVRLALLLIAGILLFYYLEPETVVLWIIFASLILLFFLVEWRGTQVIRPLIFKISTLLFLCIVVVFGMLRMQIRDQKTDSPTTQLLAISDWEEVVIQGTIQSISKTSTGKIRWDLNVDSTALGSVISDVRYKARILADEVHTGATLGDRVIILGTVIPISEKRNPYEFNYKQYLKSQQIAAQIKATQLYELEPNTAINEWIWWREQALSLVDKNFDAVNAPIAKALLIGYKKELDSESKKAFSRSGLSHIMAVSGLHVGFVVAPFWVFIPYFWTKKFGSTIGLFVLLGILFAYAGLTGFSPSVMRASVMAVFLSYGKLFHKINDSLNLTAAAAIVLLIINPAQLFDIGFQLSFSAVIIILLILPVIQKMLPYWLRIRWYGKPLMVIIVSIVVQFGLYPLQVFYFGEISLVSPISNALFVPFLGLIVPISLIALGISAVIPWVGLILNYPSDIFLGWMNDFVNMAAGWEWAWTAISFQSPLLFVLWMFLIFGISSFHIAALRWKLIIGFLCVACLMVSQNIALKLKPAELEITFFDVGQGDAALLITPNKNHVLIDAGVWSPGYNSGKSIILPHLKALGVDTLDAVFLSHPHADHIGGIVDLIQHVPIKTIYNSGYPYDSNLYKNYLQLAGEKSIPVEALQSGDIPSIDPAMLFLVLGPDDDVHGSDPNEHSLILQVIYGESEILFTGDAGTHQEQKVVRQYQNLLDADILKVGHHGSRTSSSISFLDAVTPQQAIISLAERNKFRHPHPEAISRLQKTKAELLFTSLERAVVLASDGQNIRRINW